MPAFSAKPVSLAEAKSLFAGLDDWPALVLAVSGGPDSTALMLLAARWRDALKGDKPKLIAVTVDHGLRPEAKREAAAVARLARKLKVTHRTLRWTGRKPATGLQQAARHARYRLLAEAARKAGASHILTAHTLDDQAETVLIRLSRGSGLTGLGAMQGVTTLQEHSSFRNGAKRRVRNPGTKHERVALDSGLAPSARPGMTSDEVAHSIVRPLLDSPQARQIATLHAAKIPYAEDPSNRDPRFTRVRLRGLMAQLAGEGLTAPRLVQVAHRLRRADRALAEAADRAAAELARRPAVSGTLAYDAGGFGRLPAEVALRLLGRAVGALGDEGPVELAKLERLKSALDTAQNAGLKRFRRTLAGALVTLAGDRITVERAPPRRSRALTTGRASGPKAR